MKQITVSVIDPVGLHARPATVAVNAASKFKCEVNVSFKGREVNMKSIMGVMSLGIPTQSEITISCNGDDEDAAIAAIEEVLRAQKIIEKGSEHSPADRLWTELFLYMSIGWRFHLKKQYTAVVRMQEYHFR